MSLDLDHAQLQRLRRHADYLGRCARRNLADDLRAVIDYAEACHHGDCEVSREVVDALVEVGGWEEIDGDGSPASVLADHVRALPRIIRNDDT